MAQLAVLVDKRRRGQVRPPGMAPDGMLLWLRTVHLKNRELQLDQHRRGRVRSQEMILETLLLWRGPFFSKRPIAELVVLVFYRRRD